MADGSEIRRHPQGPPEWHPAPAELQEAARNAAQLAASRGVSLPKLAIVEAVRTEGIASHLVGFCTPEQVGKRGHTLSQRLLDRAPHA